MDESLTFGALLKRHRQAAGLSQEQLAERAGLTAQTVSALERGFRRAPYRDTVRTLAQALALGEVDAAALDAAVTRGRTAAAGAPDARSPALPLAPAPLIGRERELAEVEALLHRAHADSPVRLLTLMGPGGVGKTRLALQVADTVAAQYAEGAVFVALAPLRDPALIMTAIARVLRVKEMPDRSLSEALHRHLREKHLLLLLDNFEHLLAAAPVIADLLAACAGLHVLVTSRARLHLRGEHLYLVPPLRIPESGHTLPLGELAQVPAVAFLLDRARAAVPDFVLDATTAPTIAALCRRLDGLPLALELAAPRLTTLSPAVLLLRLSSRLRLLTEGPRDLPARQQTLRATLDWSYALLSPGEQAAFRRLSVFPAGCTLEAATSVCMASDAETATTTAMDAMLAARDMAEWIGALVDQSLLHRERGPGNELHFTMLETVREFGLERLAESGEADRVHRRHADCTLALTRLASQRLGGPQQEAWLARLEGERDNVRAALAWAGNHGDTVLMQRLTGTLWRFWLMRGSLAEGRKWLDQALQLPSHDADIASPTRTQTVIGAARLAIEQGAVDAAAPLVTDAIARAREQGEERLLIAALHAGGLLERQRGQYPEAVGCYEEALTRARAIGDGESIAAALVSLGYLASVTGDAARGAAHYEESLQLSRATGDTGGIADALMGLAWQVFHRSDYPRVEAFAGEALALFRTLGDAGRTAEALWLLGIGAQQGGDFDHAVALHAESLALRRDRGDERGVAQSLSTLTQIALWQGDLPGARELAMDALAILRQYHDRWPLAMVLTLLGHVELAAGDRVGARAVLGESARLFGEIGNPLYLPWCLEGLAGVAVIMGQFERAARLIGAGDALQRRLGWSLPPANPAGDTRTREAVRIHLGVEAATAARASGEALPLDAVLADALEATQ